MPYNIILDAESEVVANIVCNKVERWDTIDKCKVPVYTSEGKPEGEVTLHIYGLAIVMTAEQMKEVRFFFENT